MLLYILFLKHNYSYGKVCVYVFLETDCKEGTFYFLFWEISAVF